MKSENRLSNKITSKGICSRDDGFTLIEIIMVIVMTGLMSLLFSQTLVSTVHIYSEHSNRKTANADVRRSFDMLMHDLRELESWYGGQQATEINFNKYNLFHYSDGPDEWDYYATVRVGYRFSGAQMTYRRNDDGSWNNFYLLLDSGVVPGATGFSSQSQGGITRIITTINMTVMNSPLRMRMAVFPRRQGA